MVLAHYRGAANAREEHMRCPQIASSLLPTLAELRGLASRLGLRLHTPSELGVPGATRADEEATLEKFYLVVLERSAS